MSYDNWKEDFYTQKWLNKVAKRTRVNYREKYPHWLAFIKMSPTEQIERRIKDLQSLNPQIRGFFEDKLIEFKNTLQTQYDNEHTIRSFLTTVRSFFSKNRLKLQFGRGELDIQVSNKVVERKWIPSNIEIRVIYGQADVRDRALLLVLYQSGLSEIDVSSLNIENLDNIYEHEGHLFIEKKREKTNTVQATCISVEAIHDIRAMLRERGSPKKGILFTSPRGKRLAVRFINEAMKKLAEKAYPQKKFKTKELRDSYNSALLRANIQPQELKDLLMGHRRKGARKDYAYDEITILEAYEKAFRYLSINHGKQARKDLDRIEQTVMGLSELVTKQQKRITEQQSRIETLGKQMVTFGKTIFKILETSKKIKGVKFDYDKEEGTITYEEDQETT